MTKKELNELWENPNKGLIKEMTSDQVTEAATFAWSVYQDESKRTTPPYHCLEQIVGGFQGFVDPKSDCLLGYFEGEQLMGVMALNVEPENHYCSAYGPYIENAQRYFEIAEAFMAELEVRCKGYRCFFGTTKPNVNSQMFLESKGFVCTDDTIQTRVNPSDLKKVTGPFTVQALTEEDYELYRAFHMKYFSGYYWSAERIYKVLDRWDVFIVKIEGEIVGNTFTLGQSEKSGEVYGGMVLPQYEQTEMLSQLFYESTAACFKRGVTEIVNFIPEGYQLDAAKRVGYVPYDTYMCYEKQEL